MRRRQENVFPCDVGSCGLLVQISFFAFSLSTSAVREKRSGGSRGVSPPIPGLLPRLSGEGISAALQLAGPGRKPVPFPSFYLGANVNTERRSASFSLWEGPKCQLNPWLFEVSFSLFVLFFSFLGLPCCVNFWCAA